MSKPPLWKSVRRPLATFVRGRVHRVLPEDVTSSLNRNDREGALYRAWGHLFSNHIQGAYYEFGVYRGESFRAAWRLYKIFSGWLQDQLSSDESWRPKFASLYADFKHAFYAFDTFEGMPENDEKNPNFLKGNFRCSLKDFTELNRRAGLVTGDRVRTFIGTFCRIIENERETLSKLQPAGIVNIDCDLYGSTLDALNIVKDKLVQGSVLLVDDWNSFSAHRGKGQRLALHEFMTRHPEFYFEPWFAYHFIGQSFIVHKNSV